MFNTSLDCWTYPAGEKKPYETFSLPQIKRPVAVSLPLPNGELYGQLKYIIFGPE